jgi:hypothetical protein
MIKYGLISRVDANVLEKTIDLICDEFAPNNLINVTEVGLFDCGTARGIKEYVYSKQWLIYYTGIDSEKDKPINAPFWLHYIKGNSSEVYNQIKDESQHLIVQDANHSYPNAIQDFFCYMKKVKVGGYMWWHDTAIHVQGTGWQRMGDPQDPDMAIAVRKALTDIGLFDNKYEGWEFVMEDADLNDTGGGCAVFRRIK